MMCYAACDMCCLALPANLLLTQKMNCCSGRFAPGTWGEASQAAAHKRGAAALHAEAPEGQSVHKKARVAQGGTEDGAMAVDGLAGLMVCFPLQCCCRCSKVHQTWLVRHWRIIGGCEWSVPLVQVAPHTARAACLLAWQAIDDPRVCVKHMLASADLPTRMMICRAMAVMKTMTKIRQKRLHKKSHNPFLPVRRRIWMHQALQPSLQLS